MYFSQINVIWIAKVKYTPGWVKENHRHNYFQLFYVFDGKGNLRMENKQYHIKGGDLFVFPPGCRHGFNSEASSPLKTIEIKFEVYNRQLMPDLNSLCDNIDIDAAYIKNMLEKLVEKAINKGPLYRDVINASSFLLLLKILEFQKGGDKMENLYEEDLKNSNNSNGNNLNGINFDVIFDYMKDNLSFPISLNDLSKLVGVNPTYLCRAFKIQYGLSPIQYLNNYRLAKAKELLRFSEYNVTEIAETVGFQTIHYFSKYFKEKERISPMEYRKKVKESVFIKLEDKYKYVEDRLVMSI